MPSPRRHVGRILTAWAAYGLLAALVAAPVAAQQALTGARFEDRLGALPVEVSLQHNGVSTLDTGILGRIHYDATGPGGFGARIRSTGPPQAGGTLASYVSPEFVRTNAQFLNDPGAIARAYSQQLAGELWRGFARFELWAGLLGGALLTLVFRARPPLRPSVSSPIGRAVVSLSVAGAAFLGTSAGAIGLLQRWDGNDGVGTSYAMPGTSRLSFSAAPTLEIARQVQPFIEKNTDRIRERSQAYVDAAETSLRAELPRRAADLAPREGEQVVVAEADPQGSLVGTRVRRAVYPLLAKAIGEDAIVLRTIAGDISSNGTVAEEGFVRREATASPGVPVAAVKGDHDTGTTVEQLESEDVEVLDVEAVEIGDLRVAGANDPAFKSLFGGLVVNDTGVSETELGVELRAALDPAEPAMVLLHQPQSVAGYLGESLGVLERGEGRETTPWDDGIPDLPPGSVTIGHLHDPAPPRVVWNTDGDEVTWTVVSQLGTSGGVEEAPTFNRFSTPFSVPLKDISLQLQYVVPESGLQTGYATVDISPDGEATIGSRVDVGLPTGQPLPRTAAGLP